MGITVITSNGANIYIFKEYILCKNLLIPGNDTKRIK